MRSPINILLILFIATTAVYAFHSIKNKNTNGTNTYSGESSGVQVTKYGALTEMENEETRNNSTDTTPIFKPNSSSKEHYEKKTEAEYNLASPPPDFPYYSWEQKLAMYYAGRSADSVPYPDGLDFKGVEQLSDNVYAIDHQVFNQQLKSQDLLGQAKFEDRNGQPTLSEVVPGGVFDRLGFLPGDQINSVAGTPVHSYADLYNAYQSIQGRSELTTDIRRNGHDIQFTFFIQ